MRVLAAAALVLGALAWAATPLELAQAACEKRVEACAERDRLEAEVRAARDAARARRVEQLRAEIAADRDAGR